MYVDDIKLAGKKQNIDPMWKVLNKEVDLGEPTSNLHDHNRLGNSFKLGCLSTGLFLSVYADDVKLAGKTENI